MKPNTGDIYCIYHERLQQYTACQVTGFNDSGETAAILELDWSGDELPAEAELRHMKPLVVHFYFWNNQLQHFNARPQVPQGYILAGNIPPLITKPTNSYKLWITGNSLYSQRQWEKLPETLRKRFKAAHADTSTITIGKQSFRRSTNTLREPDLQSFSNAGELAMLPCLTGIFANRYYDYIVPYVNNNPLMNELQLYNHGQAVIDLSPSNLKRLIIDASGLKVLYLNDGLTFLSLTGNVAPELTIHASEQGRWLTLQAEQRIPVINSLANLGSLHLNQLSELALLPVLHSYPNLTELQLWGKPGQLTGLDNLAQFQNLQSFSTYDLFGFGSSDFPPPEQLPRLSSLSMDSLPADAAKAIKAAYKPRVAYGLDLYITKPRKPQWLAENLNNPFRDWDGRDNITAANAKKAFQLYKKMRTSISALVVSAESPGTETAAQELKALVVEYTEAFNKMDRRTGFIETIEREEIYTVLLNLLDEAQERLSPYHIQIDRDALHGTFGETCQF
ncbi:hypothetical protein [Paenibacillus albidus]|nr:hypothetical protein [Paenibacillus albidus]